MLMLTRPRKFLYQAGYLTIKHADEFGYILGFLNEEVKQIIANQYMEPFKADKRKVIGLAVVLDEEGKGLIDWEEVN